jgi:hypothetical protein
MNATTSSFASQVSSAAAGQTICLASGSYGTFSGTNKAITIRAADGATPTMKISFGSGDQGFTIDGARATFTQSWGMKITGGDISSGAKNITIENTDVSGEIVIDGPTNANLLFDHNLHHDLNGKNTTAAFHLPYGSSSPSGVTIQNSLFRDMSSDGIQTGLALTIIGNEFSNVDPQAAGGDSSIHTDAVQLYSGCSGSTGTVIRRNYFHKGEQAIGAFDGTCGNLIEDNVIQNFTAHWITLGGDRPGSTVRHNTLVGTGGRNIDCSSKSGSGASQTAIQDNIAGNIVLDGGTRCTPSANKNNMLSSGASGSNFAGTPQFVGGASPTTYAGFKLAPGSPGRGAASDGLDVGARIP